MLNSSSYMEGDELGKIHHRCFSSPQKIAALSFGRTSSVPFRGTSGPDTTKSSRTKCAITPGPNPTIEAIPIQLIVLSCRTLYLKLKFPSPNTSKSPLSNEISITCGGKGTRNSFLSFRFKSNFSGNTNFLP